MSKFRKLHELASMRLEAAKKQSESYSLPEKTILFKNTDKTGRVRVGFKDFSSRDQFRFIKESDVTSLGIDIDALPEYADFSEKYRELTKISSDFFHETRRIAKDELKKRKEEFLFPFYLERRKIYDEYMTSEEWLAKRKDVFLLQGDNCVDCGAAATEVHHLHYETLGDECAINDLVPICNDCHKARHGLKVIEP